MRRNTIKAAHVYWNETGWALSYTDADHSEHTVVLSVSQGATVPQLARAVEVHATRLSGCIVVYRNERPVGFLVFVEGILKALLVTKSENSRP